jgi:hypothetical protein
MIPSTQSHHATLTTFINTLNSGEYTHYAQIFNIIFHLPHMQTKDQPEERMQKENKKPKKKRGGRGIPHLLLPYMSLSLPLLLPHLSLLLL